MIRFGKHLTQQTQHQLIRLVVSELLLGGSAAKLEKKLNIHRDSISAIKRGMTVGDHQYIKELYAGKIEVSGIYKDLNGKTGKRSFKEAYKLVGGDPVSIKAIDLTTPNVLSVKKVTDGIQRREKVVEKRAETVVNVEKAKEVEQITNDELIKGYRAFEEANKSTNPDVKTLSFMTLDNAKVTLKAVAGTILTVEF